MRRTTPTTGCTRTTTTAANDSSTSIRSHRTTWETLQRQCVYEPGYQGPFETNPLVRNGTMYLTAGTATMAIDAVTCEVVWRHDWEPRTRGGFPMQRGVALKDGIVVRGTSDSHLLALDAATGELLWEVLAANPERGEAFTMPPMIFEDLVIIGPCCSETGVRGWVGGFRLEDGTQAWRFNTVPEPGEPGAETWSDPGNHFVGGGAVWTPFALDPRDRARVHSGREPGPGLLERGPRREQPLYRVDGRARRAVG